MVEKWLEAYVRWEPAQQVVFSGVLLIAGLVVMVLAGLWTVAFLRCLLEGLATCIRGYPAEPAAVESEAKIVAILAEIHEQTKQPPIRVVIRPPADVGGTNGDGHDWRKEMEQIEREAEIQAKCQQQLQVQMDEAGKNNGHHDNSNS